MAWYAEKSGVDLNPKRYRFTGMERDDETGMQYHSQRYYLPWLGRWERVDPIGLGGGGNRFSYTMSNPTVRQDLSGLDWTDAFTLPSVDDVVDAAKGVVQTGAEAVAGYTSQMVVNQTLTGQKLSGQLQNTYANAVLDSNSSTAFQVGRLAADIHTTAGGFVEMGLGAAAVADGAAMVVGGSTTVGLAAVGTGASAGTAALVTVPVAGAGAAAASAGIVVAGAGAVVATDGAARAATGILGTAHVAGVLLSKASEQPGPTEVKTTPKKRGPVKWPDGPHNETIKRRIDDLKGQGYEHTHGGPLTEEVVRIPGGGHKTARRPDITMKAPDGTVYRENVGKSLRDNTTPISRERKALDDLEKATGTRPGYTPYDK